VFWSVRRLASALVGVNRSYFLDGFAFSQEEGGAVSQSDMIRVYNTCSPDAEGV